MKYHGINVYYSKFYKAWTAKGAVWAFDNLKDLLVYLKTLLINNHAFVKSNGSIIYK